MKRSLCSPTSDVPQSLEHAQHNQNIQNNPNTSNVQITACLRCRKQKLRCTRELPTCQRCLDVAAECSYPPPPDRKLLAAQRFKTLKARGHDESESTAAQQQELQKTRPLELASSNVPDVSVNESSPSTSSLTGRILHTAQFPSPEIAAFLVEIYFDHIFIASLLFHRPTLTLDLERGNLPDFVPLSIFACTAIYLRSPTSGRNRIEALAQAKGLSASTLRECGEMAHDFATAASQQVLVCADQPRFEIIQACLNLSVYWLSRGHLERVHIHAHIAYRSCRLLGYHTNKSDNSAQEALQAERRRRCFWAAWIVNCVGQDNASFKAEPWREAIHLPLPCDESGFLAGKPVSREAFDEEGSVVVLVSESENNEHPSAKAEFVKMYGLWWEVQRLIREDSDSTPYDTQNRLTMLRELDRRLEKIYEDLKPDLLYSNPTRSFGQEDKFACFTLNSIYHLSNAALHSSIVPLFSNFKDTAHVSKKMSRISAYESLKHSRAIASMAANLVHLQDDVFRLPSMVGYVMFLAITIMVKSLKAQDKISSQSIAGLIPAISIVNDLRKTWFNLQPCWIGLDALLRPCGVDVNSLTTRGLVPSKDDDMTDFNKILNYSVSSEKKGSPSLYTWVYNVEKEKSAGHEVPVDEVIEEIAREPPAGKTEEPTQKRPKKFTSPPMNFDAASNAPLPIEAPPSMPVLYNTAGPLPTTSTQVQLGTSLAVQPTPDRAPTFAIPARSEGLLPNTASTSTIAFVPEPNQYMLPVTDRTLVTNFVPDYTTMGVASTWWEQPSEPFVNMPDAQFTSGRYQTMPHVEYEFRQS